MKRKFISFVLAGAMILSSALPAMAAESKSEKGFGSEVMDVLQETRGVASMSETEKKDVKEKIKTLRDDYEGMSKKERKSYEETDEALKNALKAVDSAIDPDPITARQEDKPNSWRFFNGEPVDSMMASVKEEASNAGESVKDTDVIIDTGDVIIAASATAKYHGIDVSKWQGTIDWEKASKSNLVKWAILRCGFGNNGVDVQWERNATQCEKYNIPYGAYLYSYATSLSDVQKEIANTKRLLSSHKAKMSLPIYYDMEDNTQYVLGRNICNQFAVTYLGAMKAAGYRAGLYSNLSWLTTRLTDVAKNNNYWHWIAQYNTKCTYTGRYESWQYGANGSVPGISGNVDSNWWYTDSYKNLGSIPGESAGNGWKTVGDKTYYYKDGKKVTGLQTIEGKIYYFNTKGVMQTGWQTINERKYYFKSKGYAATGITTIKKIKYGFSKKGILLKGLKTIDDNKYYLNSDGVVQTGWKTISGKVYHFNSSGVAAKGLKTIGSKTYGFDDDCALMSGLKKINGDLYYFNESGVMQTGWQNVSGKVYYFKSGVAVKGIVTINKTKYGFSSDGVLQSGMFAYDKKNYYLNNKGIVQTGWRTISGKKYYFKKTGEAATGAYTISSSTYVFGKNGARMTGLVTVDGSTYYAGKDGAVIKNKFKIVSKKKYYFTSTGKAAKGLKTIGGKKYYFNKSGVMRKGLLTIKSKKYYFGSDGTMQSPPIKKVSDIYTVNESLYTPTLINDVWMEYSEKENKALHGFVKIPSRKNVFYYNKTGAVVSGWQTILGNTYYFDPQSAAMATKFTTVDGKKCYFTSKGILKKGWITVEEQKYYCLGKDGVAKGSKKIGSYEYYFKSTGVMKTGWLTLNGKKYYFDEEGHKLFGKQKIGSKTYVFDLKTGELKE